MIVLTALTVAWRWEAVGGILFIALGTWGLLTPVGPKDPVISGPPFLLGGLFLLDWAYRARVRPST
jgi:hypothetical protein